MPRPRSPYGQIPRTPRPKSARKDASSSERSSHILQEVLADDGKTTKRTARDDNSIQIQIKNRSGSPFTVKMGENQTIRDLKLSIERHSAYDESAQTLVINGRELKGGDDDTPLRKVNIGSGTEVELQVADAMKIAYRFDKHEQKSITVSRASTSLQILAKRVLRDQHLPKTKSPANLEIWLNDKELKDGAKLMKDFGVTDETKVLQIYHVVNATVSRPKTGETSEVSLIASEDPDSERNTERIKKALNLPQEIRQFRMEWYDEPLEDGSKIDLHEDFKIELKCHFVGCLFFPDYSNSSDVDGSRKRLINNIKAAAFGFNFSMRCHAGETIGKLKKRITDRYGFYHSMQEISCNSTKCDDQQTVGDLLAENDATEKKWKLRLHPPHISFKTEYVRPNTPNIRRSMATLSAKYGFTTSVESKKKSPQAVQPTRNGRSKSAKEPEPKKKLTKGPASKEI